MIEHRIAGDSYWAGLSIADQDLEELGLLLCDAERPMTIQELARALIGNRCQRAEAAIRRQLTRGRPYRPSDAYQVGDNLVFAMEDFALGTVVSLRDGHNPEYDEFKVIEVQMDADRDGRRRLFAAELKTPHRLSTLDPEKDLGALSVSVEDLVTRYGKDIAARLESRLASAPNFVSFRDQWVHSGLLADVHIGYLNIAEAVIDVNGSPVSSHTLLADLELSAEIPEVLRVFSLDRALSLDERFDDVGDASHVVWSLRRWQDAAVRAAPSWLAYEPTAYDRTNLDVVHLQLEREIDDEFSGVMASPSAAQAKSLTLTLSYPHWRGGTLPLTDRTRVFFPKGSVQQHTQITLVDRTNHREYRAWVVRDHRYVLGLADWYESNTVPVGAHITLERLGEPNRVAIDFIPRRMQRDWARTAYRDERGQLAFQMQKRAISCEYDELCLVDELDRQTIDRLRQQELEAKRPLLQLVLGIFAGLAKIDPDGKVHAKTLYNAVNMIRRCPPGLLFALLFERPNFVPLGDGYWVLQTDTREP